MRRRAFLQLGLLAGAGLLRPRRAQALGEGSLFQPALAQHGGNWELRKNGLRRLAWELSSRTSVEVLPAVKPVALADRELFKSPFVYLGSDGALPPLSEAEVANLRRYLTYGGFLLAESNDPGRPDFDQSFRRELARVLPQSPLSAIPQEHVVYKSFYLLDHPSGRLLESPAMEMAKLGKRAAVIYSRNDMAGAWSRDDRGDWEFEVSPGGEQQREYAIRTGVNVAMYALCLDYKDDAVHLDYIMRRRR
jgi:hypothetical protein